MASSPGAGVRGKHAIACLGIILMALLAAFCLQPASASADEAPANDNKTSVLVIDSGLGDADLVNLHWLGDQAKPIAEANGHELATIASPAWWSASGGTGTAPATFVLYAKTPGIPTTADDIAWALDQIRASGAEPRTFAVAMGATGLPLREYAQDLASVKQSDRADLVGMAFCGTPQNGYSVMEQYPESTLWATIAASIGVSASDLSPQSAYIGKLNAGAFPNVCKTLSVEGAVGDLGFDPTDGVGVAADFALMPSLSSQVERSQANATIGQSINLSGAWAPFTSAIDFPQRNVDAHLAERLSAMNCYGTSAEVQSLVRDFYESWFAGQVPVTYNANTLLIDLSGSMLEVVDGEQRLAAAQQASKEYLTAMQSYAALPQAAPVGAAIFGFGEQTRLVTQGYDDAARGALDGMQASGETDIGLALDTAVAALQSAPACAEKHILLLSDGASTQGQSEQQIFDGSIATAVKSGIVIDAVGFGDVGESDVGFLKRVTEATGGTFYEAKDAYNLKVGFLDSYYESLGLGLADDELPAGKATFDKIGETDNRISAVQIGIVAQGSAPSVKLTSNGDAIDASLYTAKTDNGFTSITLANPPVGKLAMDLSDHDGAVHVFAVKQRGITDNVVITGEAADYSLFILAGVGAALVVVVIVVIVVSRGRTKRRTAATVSAAAPAAAPIAGAKHSAPAPSSMDAVPGSWNVTPAEQRPQSWNAPSADQRQPSWNVPPAEQRPQSWDVPPAKQQASGANDAPTVVNAPFAQQPVSANDAPTVAQPPAESARPVAQQPSGWGAGSAAQQASGANEAPTVVQAPVGYAEQAAQQAPAGGAGPTAQQAPSPHDAPTMILLPDSDAAPAEPAEVPFDARQTMIIPNGGIKPDGGGRS